MNRLLLTLCALAIAVVPSASADGEAPGIVAQAYLQDASGVLVTWTAPPVDDGFVVERSRAGGPFAAVATVASGTSSYLDPAGAAGDVYVVSTQTPGLAFTSNPAPVLILMSCEPLGIHPSSFPFLVSVNTSCSPVCIPFGVWNSPPFIYPVPCDLPIKTGFPVPRVVSDLQP